MPYGIIAKIESRWQDGELALEVRQSVRYQTEIEVESEP